MSTDHNKEKDKEQEYMKTDEQGLERQQPHATEKEGLEKPRTTGYKPLQIGLIIFAIAVLIIVGFAIGFDWFGLFGN